MTARMQQGLVSIGAYHKAFADSAQRIRPRRRCPCKGGVLRKRTIRTTLDQMTRIALGLGGVSRDRLGVCDILTPGRLRRKGDVESVGNFV